MLAALLLASNVFTVECSVISVCEEGAAKVCGKATVKTIQLRGPYKDGTWQLDFVCIRESA
jgi:hypothetical protein